MQLPPSTASYAQRVSFGRYVARRIRRKKQDALADQVLAASLLLRTLGRAWEDSDDPVQDGMGDRDGADDDLDTDAKNARADLAGRSADAVKKEPYKLIVPMTFDFYTKAPIGEEQQRYTLLKERVVEHLPANDTVRKTLPKQIDTGLAAHAKALDTIGKAQRAQAGAKTKLDAATAKWRQTMESVYGTAVTAFGKAEAESLFRRRQAKGSKAAPGAPVPSPA